MEYFWIVLPKMGGFLLLVLIGFLASRLGVVKREALTSISGFLIKIVLPALVVSLIWENHTTVFSLLYYGRIVLWQIGAYLLLACVGLLASRIFKLPGTVRNVFCGCMVGGNFGFLVIPLILALFEETEGTSIYRSARLWIRQWYGHWACFCFSAAAGDGKISARR